MDSQQGYAVMRQAVRVRYWEQINTKKNKKIMQKTGREFRLSQIPIQIFATLMTKNPQLRLVAAR